MSHVWRLFLILSLVSLVVPRAALAAESGMGPAPFYSNILRGDYVTGGASTRMFFGPPQTDPFGVGIAGIPAGATVVKAYANWTYLTNAPGAASEAAITINGTPVGGALTGTGSPDLCWGFQSAAAYTADVTSIVQAAGGNGVYTVGSATDDPFTGAIGEGISIVVVYQDLAAPLTKLNLYRGYTSTESGPATAVYDFSGTGPYGGGPAHFFINASDGQTTFTDDFLINGILASGAIPGTGAAGNAWLGLLGPGPANTNLYDHAEGNVAGFLAFGDTSLTTQTLGFGNADGYEDCIGHSIGALSFAIPEPATVLLLAAGALAVRRRK